MIPDVTFALGAKRMIMLSEKFQHYLQIRAPGYFGGIPLKKYSSRGRGRAGEKSVDQLKQQIAV